MVRNLIFKLSIAIPFALTSINAQDADPIEAARQAKLAAEKAAADAEAATGAAIEAAAAKAASEAREKVIADREAEKARKLAEKEAAENAEMDAAAEAAALQARRKLAAELGLELEEVPDSTVQASIPGATDSLSLAEGDTTSKSNILEGYNIGIAPSLGLISGETFSEIPLGATAVITTPFGFDIGPLKYTISIAVGGYLGEFNGDSFNPSVIGIGGNLNLLEFIFAEGHIGQVGDGIGLRGFGGVSLERLMKKGLNLPFNILIGSELFLSNDMAGVGNASGWISVGARLDYNF